MDVDSDALGSWMTSRLGEPVRITGFAQPKSGYSAETRIFDVELGGDGAGQQRRFVLRRETGDPSVYPRQAPGLDVEIEVQYRMMAALHEHAKVPLAPLVGYESDPSVLGAPFFVMGFVGGDVPIEDPPYSQAGFFVELTPEERTRLIDNGLAQVAAVHSVDWRAAGLDWLVAPGTTPGTAAQMDIWQRFSDEELAGRDHPDLAEAWRWLRANLSSVGDEQVCLCWGDPRPGNIIWNRSEPLCLTDFEAASIASPLQDLAWWLMFDRTMHPGGGRPAGDPTLAEQRAMYARHAGIEVPDTTYHEIFAAARYSVIVVRVINRMVARGHMPADNTIWLRNPASDCLAELLAEL
ncbi:MAG: phosphotransferase family protein [Frankia sp.]|nr:phosphotransferase family protein [Frankia sp.]